MFQVDTLVKTYLSNAGMEMIQRIISWVLEEAAILKSKGDTLQTFPSIQR